VRRGGGLCWDDGVGGGGGRGEGRRGEGRLLRWGLGKRGFGMEKRAGCWREDFGGG